MLGTIGISRWWINSLWFPGPVDIGTQVILVLGKAICPSCPNRRHNTVQLDFTRRITFSFNAEQEPVFFVIFVIYGPLWVAITPVAERVFFRASTRSWYWSYTDIALNNSVITVAVSIWRRRWGNCTEITIAFDWHWRPEIIRVKGGSRVHTAQRIVGVSWAGR